MATKAETFRYWTERSGSKRPKAPPVPRGEVAAAQPASPSSAAVGARKESVRAGKKAVYALEVTAGRPSRKSTRKAANRQRTDAQMQVKLRTAEVRAAPRGAGRGT